MTKVHIQIDRNKLQEFSYKWRIVRLILFGSVLRDDFGPQSDVDVMVDFAKGERIDLFDIVTMKDELEKMFGRSVDIVENGTIRNPYRKKSIAENTEVIYIL